MTLFVCKRKYLLFFGFIFLLQINFGQNTPASNTTERITQGSVNNNSDSIFFYSVLTDIRNLLFSNPDSAYAILLSIEDFVQASENLRYTASYNHYIGLVYYIKGDYTKALGYYHTALDIFQKLGDERFINIMKHNVAGCYMFFGQYVLATDYLMGALKYFESIHDSVNIANAYLQLCYIQFDQKNKLKAEEFAIKTLNYAKTPQQIVKAYNNLAEICVTKNRIYEALDYYYKALPISEEIQDFQMVSTLWLNIGHIYRIAGNIDSAYYYLEKNIIGNYNYADNYIKAINFVELAELEIDRNNKSQALIHLNASVKIAHDQNLQKVLSDNYLWLSNYYADNKNYDLAFKNLLLSKQISDSLFDEVKSRQLEELEAVYQNEKKQREIESLKTLNRYNSMKAQKNRIILISLLVFVFSTLLIGLLLISRYRIKTENKALNLEHKVLRLQMSPHFIFNAVAAIQNFIINSKPLEAASYLSKFADLMRANLLSSRNELISLGKELEMLENYLLLQNLRLNSKLEYSFEISEHIEPLETFLPPMVIQPFIENSIEHGILKKITPEGRIILRIWPKGVFIIIEIEDNGIGRKKAMQHSEPAHKSLATEIVNERMKAISKSTKRNAYIEVEDLYDSIGNAAGTKVYIQIPAYYNNN